MARERHYKSKQFYENMFDNYFKFHEDEVIRHTLDVLGYDSLEKLAEDECHSKFGLDCGWVIIYPKSQDMAEEWKLDNGRYDWNIFARPSYNPQSVTIKEIEVQKAISDLGLEDVFGWYTKLD